MAHHALQPVQAERPRGGRQGAARPRPLQPARPAHQLRQVAAQDPAAAAAHARGAGRAAAELAQLARLTAAADPQLGPPDRRQLCAWVRDSVRKGAQLQLHNARLQSGNTLGRERLDDSDNYLPNHSSSDDLRANNFHH